MLEPEPIDVSDVGGLNMGAIGTWQEPESRTWMDLYEFPTDLPMNFGDNSNVAFMNQTPEIASGHAAFVWYKNNTTRASIGAPYLLVIVSGEMARSFTQTKTYSTRLGIDIMTSAPAPIEPDLLSGVEIIIIVALVLMIIGVRSVAIMFGQWMQTQQMAIAARSMETEWQEDTDVNGDGVPDVRSYKCRNGDAYQVALTEGGKSFLGGKTSVQTATGIDWNEYFKSIGDDFWTYIGYGAAAIALVGGAYVVYRVVKGDPIAKMTQSMMKIKMVEGIGDARAKIGW